MTSSPPEPDGDEQQDSGPPTAGPDSVPPALPSDDDLPGPEVPLGARTVHNVHQQRRMIT